MDAGITAWLEPYGGIVYLVSIVCDTEYEDKQFMSCVKTGCAKLQDSEEISDVVRS